MQLASRQRAVRRWGEALIDADTERIRGTAALGLDEHLMWRRGRFRTKAWATSIVDVGRGQLLDIVPGRTARAPTRWMLARPRSWREQIRWAVLDLSGPTGPRSTRRRPKRNRSRTRSTSCGWPTTPSTRSAAGSRTRPSATAATNTTPSTGRASCSCQPRRTSPTTAAPDCGASSTPETPTATSATPGTPKRPSEASTTSPTPTSAPPP